MNLSLCSSQSNNLVFMEQLWLQHKAQVPSALHAYTQVVDSRSQKTVDIKNTYIITHTSVLLLWK